MKSIVNYIFELGVMKRRAVSGFDQFTKQDHNNLAGHAYRAAIIGVILAEREGVNFAKVGLMLLFHENGETRVGDPDFIASRYGAKNDSAEKQAFKDQMKSLPETLSKTVYALYKEKMKCETKEAHVAWDADILEQAFSAKEFLDQGCTGAGVWQENIRKLLRTKSAKEMYGEMVKGDSNGWWKRIK